MRTCTEKTLELNVNENIISSIRKRRYPKAFITGFSMKGEGIHGMDSSIDISPDASFLVAFQYKRPKGRHKNIYQFEINNNKDKTQHARLVISALCLGRNRVFYVLPAFYDVSELKKESPNFLNQTYFIDVLDIPATDKLTHHIKIDTNKLTAFFFSSEPKEVPIIRGKMIIDKILAQEPLNVISLKNKIRDTNLSDSNIFPNKYYINLSLLEEILYETKWVHYFSTGFFI